MHNKMVDYLIKYANPSIKYRVKQEVLNESVSADEKEYLHQQVMREPIIQSIVSCQKDNGWLGNGFHGPNKNAGLYENQEVGTKYLGEKLIYKEADVLKKAMNAFVTTELTDPCYRTKGRYFNEFRYAANGQNLIRCACIARAGYDNVIDIKPQIQLSLDSFKRVLEVDSILDVTRVKKIAGKNRLVFNDYEKWPCYYHLDILAHTNSWKSYSNIKMLADAINKLMRTDRLQMQVGADSWVGYILGTTGCLKEGYQLGYELDGVHYTYLDRTEWLCRCGVGPYVECVANEVNFLQSAVDSDGICQAMVDEKQLKGFGTYGGQQLEVDWKDLSRKSCDKTFRALLIIHYFENSDW